MFGLGHKAAGVSIEQTGIRYISFKNNNTKQVHKKRSVPLRPGMIEENQVADREALLDLLKHWVKTKGMRGSRVNLSIPPSQMIIRRMTIPTTNDKQMEQLVKLEVETGLHLPFENPVYDYMVTGQDEESSELILFAAPRKVVQDYVDVMEDAGLRVRSVEVSATALARSIVAGYGHAFSETMLIHLEQSLLDIYMFRAGHPVFMRTINLVDLDRGRTPNPSLEQIALAEAEAAATSEEHLSAEQIVEITAEISRMLSFYQYSLHDGSTRITEILITGSPERRKELQRELQAALPELAIALIAVDQFAEGAKPDFTMNDYRIAAGAALHEGNVRSINLLPREDRETILFPYFAATLAALWVLGAAGTGVLYVSVHDESGNQQAIVQTIQDRNAELQLELSALSQASPGAGSLDREAVIAAIAADRADAAAVLDELQAKLPYGSVIRDISYIHHDSIMLTVNFTDMEYSGDYLTELRTMPFTKSVSIDKLSEGASGSTGGNSAGGLSSLIKYSAVYQVKLVPLTQQMNETQVLEEGEVDTSGNNQ